MIDWLVTNALAALALATIAGILIWTFRPAPAVRHALWLVVVLKLVAPGGPTVALPVPHDPKSVEPQVVAAVPAEDPVMEAEVWTVWVHERDGQTFEEAAAIAMRSSRKVEEATGAGAEPALIPLPATEAPPAPPFNYHPWLVGLWVAGALFVGWRQLRETVQFARFARNARPAPDHLVAEVAIVANRLGVRVPAVRVLAGLTSPVMWCLTRPVLLWPAGLECRLKGEGRRAVIAHELAHLRRRDHWVRRLEMVAAVLHWWNPLFWIARKKLRSDAELACDAWAAGQADRRAYAEALLEVCSFNPRRRPAPAVGVFGEGRRAMQERLTMIMRDRVPCRLAFGAKLVVALMAVAAIPAWTLGQQGKPKPVEDVEDVFVVTVVDEADGDDDAQAKEIEAQIKALAQKLSALKASKSAEGQKKAAAEKVKEAQEKVTEKLKGLKLRAQQDVLIPKTTTTTREIKVYVSGKDGVKVIGADGKEIKDAKVIIGAPGGADVKVAPVVKPLTIGGASTSPKRVELKMVGPDTKPTVVDIPMVTKTATMQLSRPATSTHYVGVGASGSAITLSRATYKLSREQAAALGTLLGSIKATVMETKVDGDSITVTTTPEAQQSIGQIVRLIQGQGGNFRYEWKVAPAGSGQGLYTPVAPAVPATPTAPVRVAPPAKPAAPIKPPATTKPAQGQDKKPTADAGSEKFNVEVILDGLKASGVKVDADMAKLQDLINKLKSTGDKPSTSKKKPGDDE